MNCNDRFVPRAAPTRHTGFTMIELTVSIAVIVVMISILLPVLGDARASAHTATASSIQRQLAMGMLSYTENANGWIPGINTSGSRMSRAVREKPELLDRFADLPTQDVDWITPSAPGIGLSDVRAERMHQIFAELADPALGREADLFQNSSAGLADMESWLESRDEQTKLTATSYLMPIAFQLFGGDGSFVRTGPADVYYTRFGQFTPRFVPQTYDAVIPDSFTPRVTRIGVPEMKIANATGLRFYDEGDEITTNAAFMPERMGAFATWGAIYTGSQSYGQPLETTSGQDRNATNGAQAPLVYRHSGKIIAAFFDGHVESLGVESSQNPSLWFPTGSTMGGNDAGPTFNPGDITRAAFTYVDAGQRIP